MTEIEVPREELRADFERLIELAESFKDKAAIVVFERIAKQVESDTELAIATRARRSISQLEYVRLGGALAREGADHGRRRTWLEIALDLLAQKTQ